MGDSLNLSFIQHQSRFDQRLTISGGAGMYDLNTVRKLVINVFDRRNRCSERISVIVVVEGVKQGTIFSDKGGLCSGRSGIDSKECFSFICSKVFYRHLMFCMTCGKFLIIFGSRKQWIQTLYLEIHLDLSFQTLLHLLKCHRCIFLRI